VDRMVDGYIEVYETIMEREAEHSVA
jgi:hypothetical protein